ncbi:MAG: DUF2207 domain-containing protein [Caldiserica bacterium]|nr:DUF2207 domain-containing protein [Caldisericota bacterium]
MSQAPAMKKLACTVLMLMAALLLLSPVDRAGAAEAERILSFDSIVTVHTDSTITVQETIHFVSAGSSIQHGLYRYFPTTYTDPQDGRVTRVAFQVLSLMRDGLTEPWHAVRETNGVQVYFGSNSVDLEPGEHTYVFTYSSDRQLGFFDDHDELFWNVTGNAWEFPIGRAGCTIILPGTAWQQITGLTAYTGPQGAKGTDYVMSRDDSGNPVFVTTAPLARFEGLSVVVGWPKGFIVPPSLLQTARWWLRDNRALGIAALATLGLLLYYVLTWVRVGRDPRPGTIVPQYAPPEGLSPAAVRYLRLMKPDTKGLTAAIAGLAVKGALVISQDEDDSFAVDTTGSAPAGLLHDETELLQELFEGRSKTRLVFKESAHGRVQAVRKTLEKALQSTYDKGYFVTNLRYAATGVALSVAGVIAAGLLGSTQPERVFGFLFMSVWLSMWTFGVAALVTQVVASWRGRSAQTLGKQILSLPGAIGLTLFAVPFLLGELIGTIAFVAIAGPQLLALVFVTVASDVVFFRLLRAYTPQGRRLLDQIDGFRMYLSVAEKDRLNMLTPVDHTPETFERYLPYALALDVDQQWSENFADVLERTDASGQPTYQPVWFSGETLRSTSFSTLGSSLSGAFASAIAASSVAPGKSSGFSGGGGHSSGGGSSGGGGGGGGGGGW